MKLVLISPKNRTVYNFRGDLIKEIINRGNEVVVTGPDDTDLDKILELGVSFKKIPVNKNGTNIISDLRYFWRLYQLLKQEKPDATLGYTVKPNTYGAIAAKLSGVKNINSMVTGGGYTFTAKTFKSKVLGIIVRTLYKIGLSASNNVIFQNIDDKIEFCERHLVKEHKCHIVNGSGVNMEHFYVAPYPKDINFLMISRLLKSKGVCEYLEAAKRVKNKFQNSNFYLLGKYETEMQDGVDKQYIDEFINSGIIKRFEETNDVRPYYEMSSVYVLPSYREGTPRTVLEAMSMGRAIITTDTNGCRETVNGKNGFLVPVGEIDSLVDAMSSFIEKPELIELMGIESIKYCQEKFEIKMVNNKMLDILQL